MGIDGGLISGFANLTGGLRADAEQRKQKMISNVTNSIGGLGRIYAEKQAGDAIKQTLVNQLGADPAEVDNVMRQGPQAVAEYAKKKHGEMQAKKALQALGYDTTLGVDQGSPSTSFFQPQTIPDSVRTAVAGGAASSPAAPAATSTVGGVPTPASAGTPLPPPPAASPAATPAADPYDAFLRRAAGMTGLDTETLGLAAKFLPPRPKQLDPMYPEELDRIRAQTDEARAAAEAHRRTPAEKKTPYDEETLSADEAAALGHPEWAGKVSRGIGKTAFKPPVERAEKTPPDVESYAKANGVPYFAGMTFNDVAAEYKRLHPEVKDTSLADLTKLLTIKLMQTQLGNTESRDFAGLREQLQALEKKAGDIRNAATHRSAFGNGIGPKALDEDVRMLKAVLEATPRQPELAPLPTRGDVGLPPPPGGESDGPTPEEVKALEAEGKRYDPATKTIVPIK